MQQCNIDMDRSTQPALLSTIPCSTSGINNSTNSTTTTTTTTTTTKGNSKPATKRQRTRTTKPKTRRRQCQSSNGSSSSKGVKATNSNKNQEHKLASSFSSSSVSSTTVPSSTASSSSSSNISKKRSVFPIPKNLQQPPFPLFATPPNSNNHSPTSTSASTSTSKSLFEEGLTAVANLLHGRKNILVLAGAGMSVSCGIPDFRSKGTGLYETLDAHGLGLSSPQELFDLEFFKDDPEPFYKFASQILYPPTPHQPSQSHQFLRTLETQRRLLRIYTQNIDGLEQTAGVSSNKIVYAHGSPTHFICLTCRAKVGCEEEGVRSDVEKGIVPRCKRRRRMGKRKTMVRQLVSNDDDDDGKEVEVRQSTHRKRRRSRRTHGAAADHNDHDNTNDDSISSCDGILKPGITFFGETLDSKVGRSFDADRNKADAIIVIGTSLSVAPVSKMVEGLPRSIPRILINRTIVAPKHHPTVVAATTIEGDNTIKEEMEDFRNGYTFDVCLLGYCDTVTAALAKVMDDVEERQQSQKKKRNCGVGKEGRDSNKKSTLLQMVLDEGTVLVGHAASQTNNGHISTNDQIQNAKNRILLFPGAIIDDEYSIGKNQSDVVSCTEVAHCDGCQDIIKGNIMKCVDCFDFDLCEKCYHPVVIDEHYKGTHTFIVEERGCSVGGTSLNS